MIGLNLIMIDGFEVIRVERFLEYLIGKGQVFVKDVFFGLLEILG